jgi:AP endonuclease 1
VKGCPGVCVLSKEKPLKVILDMPDTEFSQEGRMITAEFEKFYLVSVYVVNSGRGLKTLERRLEFNDCFDEYVELLDKKKPVIIAGDMNVSHQEIDLANPKANKKNAGFTQEERDGMTKLLSYGFVDSFRHFYPDMEKAYTFWTYMGNTRSRNVGWRLDYFLVSKRFMKNVKDNVMRTEVMGSDHCPIVLLLSI